MTQLEFALKNFKRRKKVVVVEEGITNFFIAELFFDMDESDGCMYINLHRSNTPTKKELNRIEIEYIKGEKTGFDFYLVTEEY